MSNYLLNIIGAGKLGKTIGYLIAKHQLAHIGGVLNKNKASSLAAIRFIGAGKYYPEISMLPPADLTLIATPDDQIAEISLCLSQQSHMQAGAIIFHCSGALSSDCLSAVKQIGCLVASIHPIFSFAVPAMNIQQYAGTYCAMEGDATALNIISKIFTQFGSIPFEIQTDKKANYHAGCVFASNYLITLAEQAMLCFQQAGVKQELALQAILQSMQNTLDNLKYTHSPKKALTGPIQRADLAILQQHLHSLAGTEQQALYRLLGQMTLALTGHNQETLQKLKQMFNAME